MFILQFYTLISKKASLNLHLICVHLKLLCISSSGNLNSSNTLKLYFFLNNSSQDQVFSTGRKAQAEKKWNSTQIIFFYESLRMNCSITMFSHSTFCLNFIQNNILSLPNDWPALKCKVQKMDSPFHLKDESGHCWTKI